MAVKVPITVEGNLIKDPETGVTSDNSPWTRFVIAVNDRQFDDEVQQWADKGEPIFHQVAVFGQQARHVAETLREGDNAIVAGDLHFKSFADSEGKRHQGTQIVAKAVGPSLRFATAEVNRSPKVNSPDVAATGPVAAPARTEADFGVA